MRIGGYIAVVCHDRSALANQIPGQKSPIGDIKHLRLFTANGSQILFIKLLLKIVLAKHIICVDRIGYWLRLVPMPKTIKMCFEIKRDLGYFSFVLRSPWPTFLLLVGN